MARPNHITRAIIDATVDRGIREIAEDPNRSIRKLADMGREFSKGRFMSDVYDLFQDLLRNDDSPYYNVISQLLRTTDFQTLKTFGINFGYDGLTFGGKTIRSLSETTDFRIPWILSFEYAPRQANAITLSEIGDCIRQGQDLGIYIYTINISGKPDKSDEPELIRLCRENSECAFLFFMPDDIVSETAAEKFSSSGNAMFLFRSSGDATPHNVDLFRSHKLLLGIYELYDDDTAESCLNGSMIRRMSSYGAAFGMLISSIGCSSRTEKKAVRYIRNVRTHPEYPLILFGIPSDVSHIGITISGDDANLTLLSNGDIHTYDRIISDFRHTTSLEQLFRIAFPRQKKADASNSES
ncbi:MAG: hypothetical protein U0L49_04295 [Eubacterium sp.]|nr:hypothetical protein [Eubacterium sp.]